MIKKLISVLLLGALCLSLFAGCTGDDQSPAATTAQPQQPPLTLIENGKTEFRVVYNEWEFGNNDLLQKKLDIMLNTVKSRTGINWKSVGVSSSYVADPNTFEILVGSTGLQESLEVSALLRVKDYAVVRRGNKIVIVGGSQDSLLNAIGYFTSNVISEQTKKDSALVTFSAENELLFHYSYPYDTIMIGDKELSSFTIVIPEKYTGAEHQFAYALKQKIIFTIGVPLEVKTDKESYENEILVGKTARTTLSLNATEYEIKVDGSKVQLLAGSTVTYDYLENTVNLQLVNNGSITSEKKDEKAAFEKINDSILQKTGDVRIIFHNILSYKPEEMDAEPNPKLRYQIQAALYKDYGADVICLQEFNDGPRNAKGSMKDILDDMGYAEVPYDPNIDGDTPIFYVESRVELLKYGTFAYKTPNNDNDRYGGYSKMLIWAIFKEKDTQKIFAVCSAHLDHQINAEANARRASEALEIIELVNKTICTGEYANIPVIIGGDLNTSYNRENLKFGNTGAMTNFEKAGFINVQKTFAAADQTCSWSGPPSYDEDTKLLSPNTSNDSADDSIDHCIYKGGVTPTLFDVLDDRYTRKSSDHLPLVVDFDLN